MQTLVAITFDVDPDGTAFAAHRYEGHYPDFADAEQAQREDRLHLGPCDVCEVITNAEFLDRYAPFLSAWDRDYWRVVGYADVTGADEYHQVPVPITRWPGDGCAEQTARQDIAPDDSVMGYTPGEDARPMRVRSWGEGR